MKYCSLFFPDIANGPGIRLSIFVSGCKNHCKGCFNEKAWDFNYGIELNADLFKKIDDALSLHVTAGISFLGGDPFEVENQPGVWQIIKYVREKYPTKTIWSWTGYNLEDLKKGGKRYTDVTDVILSEIDVLVDGPFIEEKKDLSIAFRGSTNQRIIDMKKTLEKKKIIEVNDYD